MDVDSDCVDLTFVTSYFTKDLGVELWRNWKELTPSSLLQVVDMHRMLTCYSCVVRLSGANCSQ